MPDLPLGWRVRNSNGEVSGPAPEDYIYHSDDEEGSDVADGLDIEPDSEGWDDVEDDAEALNIKCLLCDTTHASAQGMIDHCKKDHDFDFLQIQQQHKLDFYSTMRLINYIRTKVAAGETNPVINDPSLWADDKYLQPALEGDALLFTIDDVVDAPLSADEYKQGQG